MLWALPKVYLPAVYAVKEEALILVKVKKKLYRKQDILLCCLGEFFMQEHVIKVSKHGDISPLEVDVQHCGDDDVRSARVLLTLCCSFKQM